MSADNAIVILSTLTDDPNIREYRVAHVQNGEELCPYEGMPNWDYIHGYFDEARVFRSRDVAFGYAYRLEDEVGFVEYGVYEEVIYEVYPKKKDEASYQDMHVFDIDGEYMVPLERCHLWVEKYNQNFPLIELLRDDWREYIEEIGERT